MDNVYKQGIRRIKSHIDISVLKVGLCRIQTSDSAQAVNSLTGIAGYVGPEAVANDVEVFWSGI